MGESLLLALGLERVSGRAQWRTYAMSALHCSQVSHAVLECLHILLPFSGNGFAFSRYPCQPVSQAFASSGGDTNNFNARINASRIFFCKRNIKIQVRQQITLVE